MRSSQVLAAVLALASFSAAWPSLDGNVKALAGIENMLYGRQDDNKNSDSQKPSQTKAPESSAPKSDDAKKTDDPKQSDKPSGSQKPTGSGKPSGKETGKPETKSWDNRLPAGGVSMITPAPIAGPQYYKVGDWVSFAWNYTSLSTTPSAIDILASCTANKATYTLAVNQSTQETGMVYWDTGAYQSTASVPLLTEMYTLIIYDSNTSVSATAAAGYLGVYNQHTFGMYTPQPYVEWKDFKCANCNPNAALSAFDTLTLRALFITSATTVGSLLYFAFSFGVL